MTLPATVGGGQAGKGDLPDLCGDGAQLTSTFLAKRMRGCTSSDKERHARGRESDPDLLQWAGAQGK